MKATLEDRSIRAKDAKHLLDHPLFVEAFGAVEHHIDAMALACDPDDAEKARRIVISKQLLAAVKREITRVVNDGTVADVQLSELEQKRKWFGMRR